MIKIILALFVLSGTLLALEWAKDLNTAITTAKKDHKNIMVMVESSHCVWCKKMKEETLSDAGIQKRLEKYVLVKVMRDDGTAMAMLPPIDGVPSTFFMKENKAIIENVLGYFNVEDFTAYIDDVEKKLKDK